jgi:hypothetical protein
MEIIHVCYGVVFLGVATVMILSGAWRRYVMLCTYLIVGGILGAIYNPESTSWIQRWWTSFASIAIGLRVAVAVECVWNQTRSKPAAREAMMVASAAIALFFFELTAMVRPGMLAGVEVSGRLQIATAVFLLAAMGGFWRNHIHIEPTSWLKLGLMIVYAGRVIISLAHPARNLQAWNSLSAVTYLLATLLVLGMAVTVSSTPWRPMEESPAR